MAEQLHLTVADLERTMTNMEFLRWQAYYARRAQREELERKKASARGR